MENCIAQTRVAVDSALETLGCAVKSETGGYAFDAVWAGYAGCARPGDRAALRPALEELFPNTRLRLTGDGELLVSPILDSGAQEGITLICGTGSLALLWRREERRTDSNDIEWVADMRRVGRSGGWGSLLADEGSGWSLGKKAITSVLTAHANGVPLLPWQLGILQHFGVDNADDLITASSRLDTALLPSVADSERKTRIAACTRICVQAAEQGDTAALAVIQHVAAEVVDTLAPLRKKSQTPPVLVVTGGLGQVDVFWDEVEKVMHQRDVLFQSIVKLPDPGTSGLESLVHEGLLI